MSNLRGEVEERMLRALATPPMTGEIVSHTLTLSNRVMVSHYPRDGWVGKVSLFFRDVVSMPDWILIGASALSTKFTGILQPKLNLSRASCPIGVVRSRPWIESNN